MAANRYKKPKTVKELEAIAFNKAKKSILECLQDTWHRENIEMIGQMI